MPSVDDICLELQRAHRHRMAYMGTRLRVEGRLRSLIAGALGYHNNLPKGEGEALFAQSAKIIKAVIAGKAGSEFGELIAAHHAAIMPLLAMEKPIRRGMEKLAGQLPVADWVRHSDQNGFGMGSLATMVGIAGNLSNYPSVWKLYRRLGLAPFTSNGKTRMGSSWRYNGLSRDEWVQLGYSPQRRAFSYMWGQWLKVKNGSGPYRKRFDEAKISAAEKHPDWTKLHCDRHGMLLATKLLVENLWTQWTRGGDDRLVPDRYHAVA